jgi:hypothetical protein
MAPGLAMSIGFPLPNAPAQPDPYSKPAPDGAGRDTPIWDTRIKGLSEMADIAGERAATTKGYGRLRASRRRKTSRTLRDERVAEDEPRRAGFGEATISN